MPRTMKLEGLNANILLEVSKGKIQPSLIATACKVKPPYVTLHCDSLEKYGYIKRSKKGIITEIALTATGLEAVKVLQQKAVGINQTLKPIYYRCHDIQVSLKLKDKVVPGDSQTLITNSKLVAMNNHVDLVLQEDGYKARLYPNSLTIYLPDISIPLNGDLELTAMSIMDKLGDIVPKLEAKLNVKVIRLDKDTLKASLVNMHIALVNHQFAETINDNGEKLYVYDDNKVLRVIVDKSHGLDEFEAIAPAYVIQDAGAIGKFTKALVTGGFDYEKEQAMIKGLIEVSKNNTEGIHEERQWFRHHDELTQALTKYFRIKISQEKAKEEKNQRRL